MNFENFLAKFFSINSLKKVLAKRYSKTPPMVFPKSKISVPNHFPKIKPTIKVGSSIGDKSKFNATVIITKRIDIKITRTGFGRFRSYPLRISIFKL